MLFRSRTELGKGGTLPDVDFGTFLKYGFRYTVLEIIYSVLPSIVLVAMMFIGSVLLGVDNGFLNFIGTIFMLVLFIIMIVVIVALYALSFAGYLRIMDTGTISAGLDFDLILNMVRNNPRERETRRTGTQTTIPGGIRALRKTYGDQQCGDFGKYPLYY